MATKKESAENNEEVKDAAVEAKSPAEVSSVISSDEAGFYNMTSLLMALIVVIPTVAIVAYVAIPNQLDNAPSSTVNRSNDNYVQTLVPVHSAVANQNQEPEWVVQQRAEMEKRRAEFDERNAKRLAENEARSEQPQWVKDHQAFMQKEREKHEQEWAKRTAEQAQNRAPNFPGYMNNPQMNANQMPIQQNPYPANAYQQNPGQYYNGYAQPVNPYNYNNAPYNGPAPYNAPYGWNGYPRR